MSPQFFPYHPRRMRWSLTLAAAGALVLTAWSMAGAVRGGEALEFARAGLTGGLTLAMLYVHLKLRPRAGWGVSVGPVVLKVSRPIEGEIEVPWSQVRQALRGGNKRDTLVIFIGARGESAGSLNERRVLVPRHLFASASDFEAVVAAIESHAPSVSV